MRAAIAVAVLYIVALQTILGSVLAADLTGPVHRLCLQTADHGEDGSGRTPPAHLHLPCCTAAHLPHPAPAPAAPETAIDWPARQVVGLAWRAEVVAIPRAPPRAIPSARGPPAA